MKLQKIATVVSMAVLAHASDGWAEEDLGKFLPTAEQTAFLLEKIRDAKELEGACQDPKMQSLLTSLQTRLRENYRNYSTESVDLAGLDPSLGEDFVKQFAKIEDDFMKHPIFLPAATLGSIGVGGAAGSVIASAVLPGAEATVGAGGAIGIGAVIGTYGGLKANHSIREWVAAEYEKIATQGQGSERVLNQKAYAKAIREGDDEALSKLIDKSYKIYALIDRNLLDTMTDATQKPQSDSRWARLTANYVDFGKRGAERAIKTMMYQKVKLHWDVVRFTVERMKEVVLLCVSRSSKERTELVRSILGGKEETHLTVESVLSTSTKGSYVLPEKEPKKQPEPSPLSH